MIFLHTTARLPQAANLLAHRAGDTYLRNNVDSDDSGNDSNDDD